MSIVKVFDITTDVKENSITDKQKENILTLFDKLSEETHLVTKCYLNEKDDFCKESLIYSYSLENDKSLYDYESIAKKLLTAECKKDGTRSKNIRDGLLFIKTKGNSLICSGIIKL